MADSSLIQRLIASGEENLPALIKRLRGAAPELEANAGSLVKRAEAAAPEVLEDAPYQKGLRQVENEFVQPAITDATAANPASSIADDVLSQAAPAAQDAAASGGLTTAQKLGLGTAAVGAGAMLSGDGGNQPPKAPGDTTNFVAAPDDKEDDTSDVEDDENDSIQHPTDKIPDDKSASDYLALSKGQPQAQIPMAPQTTSNTDAAKAFADQLSGARQSDAQNQLLFGLLKAAQTGASAASGSKANTDYADMQLARPHEAENQLKTSMDITEENADIQQKIQKRDPNSAISAAYTGLLKQLKPDIDTTGLSAEQVEKLYPQVGTIVDKQLALQNSKDIAQFHYGQLALQKQSQNQQKQDAAQTKDANSYAQWLTSQTKGRAGVVQNALGQVQRGEALNQMFEALPKKSDGSIDFNTATQANKEELVKAIDTMLSNGKPSVGGSEHLRQAYGTAFDQLAGIRKKIAGDSLPSLNEQNVISNMYDLMNRETGVARLQAARALDAGGSQAFKSLSPDQKRSQIQQLTGVSPEEQSLMNDQRVDLPVIMQLKKQGLDPAQVLQSVKSGVPIKSLIQSSQPAALTTNSNSAPVQDPKIAQYAAAHQLDYATAANILKARGYNGGQ